MTAVAGSLPEVPCSVGSELLPLEPASGHWPDFEWAGRFEVPCRPADEPFCFLVAVTFLGVFGLPQL